MTVSDRFQTEEDTSKFILAACQVSKRVQSKQFAFKQGI